MPYGLRVRVPSSAVTNRQNIGESSKGRTPDFDSVCPGSNPGSPELNICYCGVEKRYLVGLITRR